MIAVFLLFFVYLIIFVFLTLKIVDLLTTNAPFIPVPEHIVEKIVQNFELTNTSVLYDLGCGDGRILRKAAEQMPPIRVVGVEISLIPYLISKFLTRKNNRIEIRRENFFKTNMVNATHIFLFLYPKVVNDLIATIQEQCRPGTRIISCDYEIQSLRPMRVIDLENKQTKICKKLFIYNL